MATVVEQMNWKIYNKRYDMLFNYGIRNGLIFPYDSRLLENLRHIYYGGVPASIMLLDGNLANGYCADRGPLVTLGFEDDDFEVIHANIDTIRLNPEYIDKYRGSDENYAIHCFAERTLKDGTVWVYDTSIGFVFAKSLYYKMERPKVLKTQGKEETLEYLYFDFLSDTDIERDKYALHLILPNIESNLVPVQPFYSEALNKELATLKQEVEYDKICAEIEDDKARMGAYNKNAERLLSLLNQSH